MSIMGRRKFRLSVHRKNEERKRQWKKSEHIAADSSLVVTIPRKLVTISAFKISIPMSAYKDGPVASADKLYSWLQSFPLPKGWIFASAKPLILSKVCANRKRMSCSPSA